MSESKLWANSGDSHSLGERAVWDEILPKELAERMPRSEKFDGYEVVHVDGESFRREMPKLETKKVGGKTIGELVTERGATDIESRLRDLDEEGVWAEIVYDSLGLWESMIKDPALLSAANRAQNEWKASEIVVAIEQPSGADGVDPAARRRPRHRRAAARGGYRSARA